MLRTLLFVLGCCLWLAPMSAQTDSNRGLALGIQRAVSTQQTTYGRNYSEFELFNLQLGYRWGQRLETGLNWRFLQLLDSDLKLDADLYARYYFRQPAERWRPYLEINSGPTSLGLRRLSNYRTIQLGLAAGMYYHLSERFSITGDVGYNRQLRNYDFEVDPDTNPNFPLGRTVDRNSSWGQLQLRLTVRYHLSKRNMERLR